MALENALYLLHPNKVVLMARSYTSRDAQKNLDLGWGVNTLVYIGIF